MNIAPRYLGRGSWLARRDPRVLILVVALFIFTVLQVWDERVVLLLLAVAIVYYRSAGIAWRTIRRNWAFVFVFILSAADYVTPQFLGGKDGVTLGVQIQQNFIGVGNWPLAAATSFLMLLAFVAVFAVGSFILRRLKLNDIRLSS